MSLTINGKAVPVQGIRELKPGLSIQEASLKTKNNGLDEIFFNTNGKTYIAYGDSLNISALRKNQIPAVAFDGVQADIVAYDDEANSVGEGMRKGAMSAIKDTGDAVITSVKNIITTIGPSVGIAGGVGLAGLGIYKVWKSTQPGAIGAALASAPANPAVGSILDGLKSGAVGGLKIIAIAGAVGVGVTMGYGAIKGAMEARNTAKDYTSIASVTKDGTSPSNGGQPTPESMNQNMMPAFNISIQPTMPGQQMNPGYNQGIPTQAPVYQYQYNPAQGLNAVGALVSPQQLMNMQRR